MDPIQRTGDRRGRLRQAVATHQMRKLVTENGAPHVIRPRVGLNWDDDSAMADADRHGRDMLPAAQQPHVALDSQLAGACAEQRMPLGIAQLRCVACEPSCA